MINVTKTELPLLGDYNKYLKKIWKSHWVTNDGEFVNKLEKKLSKLLKIDNIALVNNATSGLLITLKTLGIKGEVVTTPFSFVATTNVLIWEGIKPVFADIDPETFNIDPDDIERRITKKTSAILAVHVYGNPCDVEKLEKIAKKHNIKLIFDAAHAFNVQYKGKSILNFGDVSVLSFHATKTFHTIEGGGIVTNDKKLLKQFKLYRNFGIKSEEEIILPGINAKMNEFQAAMGLANMASIEQGSMRRKKIYEYYLKNLLGVKFQKISATKYNYSYMPVIFKTKKTRDRAYNCMFKTGIKARKYFYPSISDLSYVVNLIGKSNLKNSKEISDSVLCLPMYPGLKRSDILKIVSIVNSL